MTERPGVIPTVAAVLAGGTGSRLGAGVPKQLVEVHGHTLLAHAVAAFERSPLVDEILVLMLPVELPAAEDLVRTEAFRKVRRVIPGGPSRAATARAAVEAASSAHAECNLVVHDAARAVVGQDVIRRCVEALAADVAVVTAVPTSDTLVEVVDGAVLGVADRSRLWRAQTPQGFRCSVLRRAYELAAADPSFSPTDEGSVVRRFLPDVRVRVVAGAEENLKVTSRVDLLLAERLLAARGVDAGPLST